MVKAARQTYHQTHRAMFEQKGSYDLSSVFWEMTQETSLLDVKIYEVQETWTSWQGLRATNHAAKASQRDIQFFHAVMPNESPNIMPLVWKGRTEGRHSCKPSEDHALSPGPRMYPVHGLFHYQCRHNEVACMCP